MFIFFFNDTASTEIYTLSLHDALPICVATLNDRTLLLGRRQRLGHLAVVPVDGHGLDAETPGVDVQLLHVRSEEHTSELQSPDHLVCRLLLENKQDDIAYKELEINV